MDYLRGDTPPIEITVTADGVAVESLAGATITVKVAPGPGGAAVITKTTSDFVTSGNVATCYIDTDTLTPGIWYVEAMVTDTAGHRDHAYTHITVQEALVRP